MEHIDFVLWMVLYPLSFSVACYFDSKTRNVNGIPPFTRGSIQASNFVGLCIYFVVAYLIY